MGVLAAGDTMRTCCLLAVVLALCGLTGCSGIGWFKPDTRIELSSVNADGEIQRHYAKFDRASYRMSQTGLVEMLLETVRPAESDPTLNIRQLVCIKSHWLPIPGRTYMEASQINAQVQYAILTPPTGIRYDGSAFVSYELDKRTGELIGQIEGGHMVPRYRMGDAQPPFGPARFEGTFVATQNAREVVNGMQQLAAQFTQPITAAGPQ